MRAEVVACQKKAELAIDSLRAMGGDIVNLIGGDVHGWADPTLRLAVAALGAVRLQLDGVLKQYLDALPEGDATPLQQSYLSQQEVIEAARRFVELAQTHDYEKAPARVRARQGSSTRQGRPASTPEAPKAAKP